jgi:hypothetical protein
MHVFSCFKIFSTARALLLLVPFCVLWCALFCIHTLRLPVLAGHTQTYVDSMTTIFTINTTYASLRTLLQLQQH